MAGESLLESGLVNGSPFPAQDIIKNSVNRLAPSCGRRPRKTVVRTNLLNTELIMRAKIQKRFASALNNYILPQEESEVYLMPNPNFVNKIKFQQEPGASAMVMPSNDMLMYF